MADSVKSDSLGAVMKINAYVHVTAEPEGFPESVVLKYREADVSKIGLPG
jgi:hypothetical protein